MIDKTAIDALAASQAISAADAAIASALNADGILALPDDWTKHDLEALQPNRRRARGAMKTSLVDHFARYIDAHSEAGASVFVDPDNMRAVAVLNLGTPAMPGHADNLAQLAPSRTAAFSALLAATTTRHSQQQLAEWLEDWADIVHCTNGDTALVTKHAIAAVRKVTIESVSRSESTQEQLSASRSAFEAVKAASGDLPLPSHIEVACVPYVGMDSRRFTLRVSVHTDGKAPTFGLRIAKLEEHEQAMADELASLVRAHVDSVPVFIGTYLPKA